MRTPQRAHTAPQAGRDVLPASLRIAAQPLYHRPTTNLRLIRDQPRARSGAGTAPLRSAPHLVYTPWPRPGSDLGLEAVPMLHLCLLGAFDVRIDGAPVE